MVAMALRLSDNDLLRFIGQFENDASFRAKCFSPRLETVIPRWSGEKPPFAGL